MLDCLHLGCGHLNLGQKIRTVMLCFSFLKSHQTSWLLFVFSENKGPLESSLSDIIIS